MLTLGLIIAAGSTNDWSAVRRLEALEGGQRDQQLVLQTNILLRLTRLENVGQLNERQVRQLLADSWTNQQVLLRSLVAAQSGLPSGHLRNLLIQPTTNGWLIVNP